MKDYYENTLLGVKYFWKEFKHLGDKKIVTNVDFNLLDEAFRNQNKFIGIELSNMRIWNVVSVITSSLSILLVITCFLLFIFTDQIAMASISAILSILSKAMSFFVYKNVDKYRKNIKDYLPANRNVYSYLVLIDSINKTVEDENTRNKILSKIYNDYNRDRAL